MDIKKLNLYSSTLPSLKSLVSQVKIYKAIFQVLASRKRSTRNTDVYAFMIQLDTRLRKKVSDEESKLLLKHVEYDQLEGFFRELESHKLGVLVARSKGDYRKRFESECNLKDLSLIVLGRESEVSKEGFDKILEKKTSTDFVAKSACRSYTFQLRPNLNLHFKLPANLSHSEAERLSFFLRSLVTP